MATIKNEIVPARLAIKSMMDSGYKNAAYALAELMDNSIQAEADKVELLCIERVSRVDRRNRERIDSIGILDNGHGMDAETLQLALQFGNGTRLDSDRHTGMGKFGMGLPSASISQARKVEVWSWTSGVKSALYTYLDVSEIISGDMSEIPAPISKKIPDEWFKVGSNFGNTGTLVVWTGLDRCLWKTGKAIIGNSEFLIGRMYRKFLDNGKVKIRMATFDGDSNDRVMTFEEYAKPNDPLYLMHGTSTPAPFDEEPMFEPWPSVENYQIAVPINYHGQTHNVYVRCSTAKTSARRETESGGKAGSEAYGKHAAKNVGISILRAGRELELDPSWADVYERRERWWGLEVEFPPALDELFGVTNNKQYASHFVEMSKVNIDDLLKSRGVRTIHEFKQDAEEDDDPTSQLLELSHVIRKNIDEMRKMILAQNSNDRSDKKRRKFGFGPEKEATIKTKERQDEGYKGTSDADEAKSPEERKAEIKDALEASGLAATQAEDFAGSAIDNSLKYIFMEAPVDNDAFFSVQPKAGVIMLTLNTEHAAFNRLVDVLEKEATNDDDVNSLKERLNNALDGLKLLLMAWARYEDEQIQPEPRQRAKEARQDWGRMAKRFLKG